MDADWRITFSITPPSRSLVFALVTPLGALLFYFGAGAWAHEHPVWLGCALAFCAGTFLCVACADLLPELQFHSHDRFKLSMALLAGLTVAVAITRFGHADHEHGHASLPSGQTCQFNFVTSAPLAAR